MTNQKLTEAATLIKAGNKKAAQNLLVGIIKADPKSKDSEIAWYGLSTIVDTHEKKRQCLQAVLNINPNNEKAINKLEKLSNTVDAAIKTQSPQSTSPLQHPIATSEKRQSPLDSVSDEQLLEKYITTHTDQGWQIVSHTSSSVQLKKPKELSCMVIVIGVVLIPVGGIGLLVLLIAVLAYLAQKEKVLYVTASELRTNKQRELDRKRSASTVKRATGKAKSPKNQNDLFSTITPGKSAVVIVALLLTCGWFFSLVNGNQSRSQSQATPTRLTLPATFTPVGASRGNSVNLPSQPDFVNYYRENHNFEWHQRPNHSGLTPWAGTLNDVDGERKLMLWTPIGKSEVTESFYSYYYPLSAQLNAQQKKILYHELVEYLSLSFPSWTNGESWLLSSLDNHFSTGQKEFETQINGKEILLEISPSQNYNDFTAILSIH